jgi:hypothetical protein
MTPSQFTGLLDANLDRIYEGDLIWSGMRRGDPNGFTVERVVKRKAPKPWQSPWALADPKTGELMAMQDDQQLRGLCEKPRGPRHIPPAPRHKSSKRSV